MIESKNECAHRCYCGRGNVVPHRVGHVGCKRFMTEAPTPIESGSLNENEWVVDGVEITDTTLRQQRGYSQHSCGCWSRWAESINSLPDET